MITFQLVTLHGIKFSQEVYEVLLPTPLGEIGVFEHHVPLISVASPGIIKIRKKSNHPNELLEMFATNGGVIEIADGSVRVLVDEADSAAEINQKEAQQALERAKELRKSAKDQVSLAEAQSLIDRHATRLQLAELKHRTKR